MSEITNYDLKRYNEEYERLSAEKSRILLQTEAVLTTAALKLEVEMNKRRLDYAHLSNAYIAYKDNDLESMSFKIVNQTISDLFFLEPNKFEFISIQSYNAGPYEFMYKYGERVIAIKIPAAPTITNENINELDWGLITVSEVFERNDKVTEFKRIIKSDDTELIARKLIEYFTEVHKEDLL